MNHFPGCRTLFRLSFLTILVVLLASCGSDVVEVESSRIRTYHYYATGNPELPVNVSSPTEPSLVLMGGNDDVDSAYRWMIQRAGIRPGTGGRFVIIRASGADGYNDYLYYNSDQYDTGVTPPTEGWVGGAALGLTSVESIVIPDRASANDPAIVAAVARAQVVFIAGGDQSNYIKYWKDTALHRTLDTLIARNVPVGGTSAGLAILGQYDYSALYDSVTSAEAMSNPYNANLTLDPIDATTNQLLSYGGLITPTSLANVITDSHVAPMSGINDSNDGRDRMGRFLTFVARLIAPQTNVAGGCPGGAVTHTQARGLAVAPRTALLLEGDGVRSPFIGKRVTNPSNTYDSAVYFASATQAPTVCAANQPLTFRQVKVQKINADTDSFNLTDWIGQGGSTYYLDIEAGQLSSASNQIY